MYYLNRFHIPAEPNKWWFVVWEIRRKDGKRHQFVKKISDPTNNFKKGDPTTLHSRNIYNDEYNLVKEIFKGLEG